MSLQGSLDSFALPDVLVLLASTKKSGELYVAGTRSSAPPPQPDTEGRLWFDGGRLVDCAVPRTEEPADAVFELLRLDVGNFSFTTGPPSSFAGSPLGLRPAVDVEPVLAEAQARLAEWREIELVVPSLDSWLLLVAEPPAAHVSMRGDQWRLVVTVGAGCAVGGAIDTLGLGELSGCRAVKELVEAGLVHVAAPPVAAPADLAPAAFVELDEESHDDDHDDDHYDDQRHVDHHGESDEDAGQPWSLGHSGGEPFGLVTDAAEEPAAGQRDEPGWAGQAATPAYESLAARFADLTGEDVHPEATDDLPAWADAGPVMRADGDPGWGAARRMPPPSGLGLEDRSVTSPGIEAGDVPDWRAELGDVPDLDALVSLSDRTRRRTPQAQETAPTPAVADAGPDTVEEGEEPLNRGLLLKFLSSVRN